MRRLLPASRKRLLTPSPRKTHCVAHRSVLRTWNSIATDDAGRTICRSTCTTTLALTTFEQLLQEVVC